jgi:uncharacterized membrane protein YccC
MGPRARQACAASFAVLASVLVTGLFALPDPWWAATSAFLCSQSTQADSLRRGILRIFGTMIGALLGLLLANIAAYDHVLCAAFLLVVATGGLMGFLLSQHSYAWLCSAVTGLLVILSGLEDPTIIFTVATNRTLEIAIGSSAAVVMAFIFTPGESKAAQPAHGFRHIFDTDWPAALHALRAGLTVMLLPFIWTTFDMPGGTQMAITATAVMAVTPGSDLSDAHALMIRACYRVLGCLAGGTVGLILLCLPLTSLLPWLFALGVGIFACMYVQTTPRGYGYVGTQAGVVYVMTLIQGLGPPTSILPGVERLAGMTGGLMVLLAISFMLWPRQPRPQAA